MTMLRISRVLENLSFFTALLTKCLIINHLKRLKMSETLIAIIRDYGLIIYFSILIIGLTIFSVFKIRNTSKADYLVKRETRRLKEHGLLVNHSYKGVSHDDGKTIRFRIIDLYYSSKYKCVVGTMYLCSKNEEIGVWKDKSEYLYSISKEFELTDLGVWAPSPKGMD